MGHHFSIHIIVESDRVQGKWLQDAGLQPILDPSSGTMSFEFQYRSMNRRGDDETVVYEVASMMRARFGLKRGWRIDWGRSFY